MRRAIEEVAIAVRVQHKTTEGVLVHAHDDFRASLQLALHERTQARNCAAQDGATFPAGPQLRPSARRVLHVGFNAEGPTVLIEKLEAASAPGALIGKLFAISTNRNETAANPSSRAYAMKKTTLTLILH